MFEQCSRSYTAVVGTNRRYADHYDKLHAQRAAEAASRERPIALTWPQVISKGDKISWLTSSEEQPFVKAWINFPSIAVEVEAFVTGWSPCAVEIDFWHKESFTQYKIWVWANAVTRIPKDQS